MNTLDSRRILQRPRRLVLFPGAFRPPHQAHYDTVNYLAHQPDIDEVVIIISNRSRPIPGTTLALEAAVAREIWAIYLQGRNRVRVEIAELSAVSHALGYFARLHEGDQLMFCAGEDDLGKDGGRFNKIHELSLRHHIPAAIIPSPTSPLDGRATTLRGYLARGEKGRDAFLAGLPTQLSDEQKNEVWKLCHQGMRSMSAIARQRMEWLIPTLGLGTIDGIDSTRPDKTDETLRVRLADGSRLMVKSAHDTPKSACWRDPRGLKPRERVYVEKRALKWLACLEPQDVHLPQLITFHNPTRTLILSDICPDSDPLSRELEQGLINFQKGCMAVDFLAWCHRRSLIPPPFRETNKADRRHWKKLLQHHTTDLISGDISPSLAVALNELYRDSLRATREGFFHLDYTPANLFVEQKLGIIDFERCSSVADPAFDVGTLLGHYCFTGVISDREKASAITAEAMLDQYLGAMKEPFQPLKYRVLAFTAATILSLLRDHKESLPLLTAKRLLATASRLMETPDGGLVSRRFPL